MTSVSPSSKLNDVRRRTLFLPTALLFFAPIAAAQNPQGQVVHVELSTHDKTTTAGSNPLELPEAFADVKAPGGIPGLSLPLSGSTQWINGERFTYAVGSIGVTNTLINPKFSGMDVKRAGSVAGFTQLNARQVAILQMTDAFQYIIGPSARTVVGQTYFYGTGPSADPEATGNSTNARGISVWPNDDPLETRIAICGETNDQTIPYSQYPSGWPSWTASTPHWSGFIAVFDGECNLKWSHQFFGRSSDGDCAITDVSIRVVGEGAQAQDIVSYCGISSHGVELDANGQPTTANAFLTPIGWFSNGATTSGAVDNGVGQWDGIVGRLANSHSAPTTNTVSNASTVVHAVVGGFQQDGLFGIADLPAYHDAVSGLDFDRFVVVGSTGTGSAGPGTDAFPFTNPPAATSADYSLGTTLVFTLVPGIPGQLWLEASSPIGSAGAEVNRHTCARDVAVQVGAVPVDPANGLFRTNVIYVVGSTDDGSLFPSVNAVATAQTQINGNGIQGHTDGFLLAARDLNQPFSSPGFIMFQKGSYHGSIYDDGLCGVGCWNEYLDHVAVSGFLGVYTGATSPQQQDLEVGTYFTDTTVTQSPIQVSDLLRIRRDNIIASGDQVPAAMGKKFATTVATSGEGLLFAEHGLGSPAGGGIAVEDRARVNIVGKTPSPYLVWPSSSTNARGYGGNDDAVRTVLDMVPDVSQSQSVGRTDGTGQPLPIQSGANGGTTPTTGLANYGLQIGVAPPSTQRIMIDWEGGLSNPCAILVDRPTSGSSIVAAFLHYGIPGNPLPLFSHPWLPGVELWPDPLNQYTTSFSQIFVPGTDQSVRFPLTLPPGTGNVYLVQAVCVMSNLSAAGSPGMLFRY